MNLYWHSTDLVIGLFPDWFAAPQPDWPPHTILTGFPLWDETGVTKAPEGLEEFLASAKPTDRFYARVASSRSRPRILERRLDASAAGSIAAACC